MSALLRERWLAEFIVAVLGIIALVSFTGKGAEAKPLESAMADAQRCAGVVMEEAAKAKGKPYVAKSFDFFIIGNSRLAAGFHRPELDLAAIVDVAAGGKVIAAGTGPLWKISLVDDKRETIEIDSSVPAERSHEWMTVGDLPCVATLHWQNISTSEEKDILSVLVMVFVSDEDNYLKWTINVENRSTKRGLWDVDFPRIESIVPAGDAQKSALLIPGPHGMAVENPFRIDRTFKGVYPGPFSFAPMQFSAVYGPARGLYLAAYDGRMFIKEFYHICSKQKGAVTYCLRNLPPNRGEVGVDYEMPYDFVMTTFKGDWFDACRLYRQWAIKQVWCSRGTVYQRADIPEWYKRIGFWMLAWEQYSHKLWADGEVPVAEKNQTIEDIKTISGMVGVPLAVHFYGWHRYPFDYKYPEFFPPLSGDEGFKKEVQTLNEAGIRMIPYINACIYDKGLGSYKKLNVERYCIKDKHGKSYEWPIPHSAQFKAGSIDVAVSHFDWVCPYTSFWQEQIKGISEKLVREYGVHGIYYDVLSGSCRECFDPHHGHTKGGGNYWAMGNRKLLQLCRESIRKINPEVMMVSENVNEAYIDTLDGFLLFGNQHWPGAVPAFQAVYHDYAITFGNCIIGGERSVQSMTMPVGESFVNGDQLGWFNIRPDLLAYHRRKASGKAAEAEKEKKRDKYAEFVIHIAHLRQNAGLKFLAFGEMLKPLQFENKLPSVEGKWGSMKDVRRMPAVLNSVWRAPDGTLGLVFCNVNTAADKSDVRYKMDVAKYGLPKGRIYIVIRRNDDGTEEVLEKYASPVFERTETIPSMNALILEVRAE